MIIFKKKSIIFGLFVLILATGCVSVDSTRLSTSPANLTPIPTDQVKVYKSENSVSCNFSEVAIISTQGSESFIGNDKLVKKAREEAGELGANGIIVSKFGESSQFLSSQPTAEILAIYETCN